MNLWRVAPAVVVLLGFIANLSPCVGAPAIPSTPAFDPPHPESIVLWPNGAPGSEARRTEPEKVEWRSDGGYVIPILFNVHRPSITPYFPTKGKATGAAIVIAPGGGHSILAIAHEGYDLGQWLADRGVAAFVLKYRLANDRAGNSPYKVEVDALADAQRAVRTVRSRAAEWGVDSDKVGFLGFSAGGELAAMTAATAAPGKPDSEDPIERVSGRPSFQMLIYPGLHRELPVDSSSPPAFLVVADNDRTVGPDHVAQYYLRLHAAHVSAELHVYNSGGHGFGMHDRPLAVTGWAQRLMEWLTDRKIVPASR